MVFRSSETSESRLSQDNPLPRPGEGGKSTYHKCVSGLLKPNYPLAVLDEHTVVYLDIVGSGAETITLHPPASW
jgi:hypothetical protein